MLETYTIKEHIGSGFQGSVYRAESRAGLKCVVKILTANEDLNRSWANNEIKFLNKIKGTPHLAQIIEHCSDEGLQKVYIFEEDAGDTTLEVLMKANKDGLPTEVAKDLFRQLLEAVTALHKNGICHRDLKPDNIIVRLELVRPSGYHLTLVDFNVAVDLL